MANIHWSIWLALGAIVTTMSTYLGPKFRFFFWVGIAMVAFGVFKVIVKYVTREETSPHELKTLSKNLQVSRCPNCRASVYTTAKFCHMCGVRLQ